MAPPSPPGVEATSMLTVGSTTQGWNVRRELHQGSMAVTYEVEPEGVEVDGTPVQLTALEFRLLSWLASRPGRVQRREQLLEHVWGYAPGVGSRTVDTHVKRLRAKLGRAAEWIETVRGVGYRLRAPED